jgi:protein TonB
MIDDCLFESRPNYRRKKPFTLAISTIVHVLLVTTLIAVPLMQTHAMPPIALPPPVQSAGPQVRIVKLAAASSANRVPQRSPVPLQTDVVFAPTTIPKEIAIIDDADDAFVAGIGDAIRGLSFGPGSGSIIGVPGGGGIAVPHVAAPPPLPPAPVPPPAPKIEIREPIRVSSTLQKSRLTKQVDPVYPPLAKTARIEGAVVLEATITEAGTVDNLRVISGNPLLVPSVIDAVKQWRYQPTLLNGMPIEVITTITVNFKLRTE